MSSTHSVGSVPLQATPIVPISTLVPSTSGNETMSWPPGVVVDPAIAINQASVQPAATITVGETVSMPINVQLNNSNENIGSILGSNLSSNTTVVSSTQLISISNEVLPIAVPIASSPNSQPLATLVSLPSVQASSLINPLGITPVAVSVPGIPINATAVGRVNLKVEDALTYLDLVKARFSDNNTIYMNFLDVMREFKAQTIDTYTVIYRVRQLFVGHKDLISGFNTFLPAGYRMEAPLPPSIVATMPITPSPGQVLVTPASGSGPPVARQISGGGAITSIPIGGVSQLTPAAAMGLAGLSAAAATGIDVMVHQASPSNVSPPMNQTVSGAGQLLRSPLLPQSQSNIITGRIPPQQSTPANNTAQLQSSSNQQQTTCLIPPGTNLLQAAELPGGSNLSLMAMALPPGGVQAPGSMALPPAEFNHAISYVNKIKNRFQSQPDVYKRFLEILHWYQKEQRNPDPQRRKHTEKEVYQEVAKLFKGQEDLLMEFNQFLPDATGVASSMGMIYPQAEHDILLPRELGSRKLGSSSGDVSSRSTGSGLGSGRSGGGGSTVIGRSTNEGSSGKMKRSPAGSGVDLLGGDGGRPPAKKIKTQRDVSLAELGQEAGHQGYTFFAKVRKALKHGKNFESFLQVVELYNQSLIGEKELVGVAERLLRRHPELIPQLRDMLGLSMPSSGMVVGNTTSSGVMDTTGVPGEIGEPGGNENSWPRMTSEGIRVKDRVLLDVGGGGGDHRMDFVDLNQLKSCGVSYRALPKDHPQPKCAGRASNPVCKEVLNDTYVSFSSMTSEDSQFVSSKKSQFEENVYRVEDERYELDMVVELNRCAISNLVTVQKRMDRMTQEELQRFHLDETLGGSSAILQKKAIQRIYGDKAVDMIHGLMRSPSVAVPLVLARLREKDEEWRHSLKKFHQNWREQDFKYYLRSLDHQGVTFKQRDVPNLRGKTLVNHIEAIAEGERVILDHQPGGGEEGKSVSWRGVDELVDGCHLSLSYPLSSNSRGVPLADAAALIIHHVKRQSSSSKEDKREMKALVRGPLQDLLHTTRFPMSDDEEEGDDKSSESMDQISSLLDNIPSASKSNDTVDPNNEDAYLSKLPPLEYFNLFYANINWYVFLRLHHILCQRLAVLRDHGDEIAREAEYDNQQQQGPRVQVAEVLRLKKAMEFGPEEYYSKALVYVKDLLDGGEDSSSFEDHMRDLFGIHAFPWFTMDRLVSCLVRQLQSLISGEESSRQLVSLYRSAALKGLAGGSVTALKSTKEEANYRQEALRLVGPGNPLVRVISLKESGRMLLHLIKPSPTVATEDDSRSQLTANLGEAGSSCVGSSSGRVRNWTEYLAKYVSLPGGSDSVLSSRTSVPVFRTRAARCCLIRLAQEAVKRRRQAIIDSGDTLPDEAFLNVTLSDDLSAINILKEEDEESEDDDNDPTVDEKINATSNEAVTSDGADVDDPSVGVEQSRSVSMRQDHAKMKNWKRDTCSLLKDVFGLSIPKRELFRDILYTDCMEHKFWSGKYKMKWTKGSYGLFVRKGRACTTSPESSATFRRKTERFHSWHSEWIAENCNPTIVAEINSWLVRTPALNQPVVAMEVSPEDPLLQDVAMEESVIEVQSDELVAADQAQKKDV